MELQNLKGKIALVTGASSGIGEAAARALAAEGVQVVLAARSRDKIETLARELGGDTLAVPTDVGDREQVIHLCNEIRKRFGVLDLLFNNAGVGYHSLFANSKPEEWRHTIDANLYGVLHCTHAALPLLRGRPGAMISTVSSVGGRHGIEGWSVYNATKFEIGRAHV